MYKLIGAEDFKQLTKGEVDSDFNFVLGEILIPAVGKLFAQYCNRPDFDKAVRTEYLSPRCSQRQIFLASPPVASSPAVQLWEDSAAPRVYGADTLLVNGTDYFVHESQGIIERLSNFVGGPKTVKCIYTGGYLTADAVGTPEDLRLAAIAQTKIFFDRREELSLSGRSLEGGSMSLLTPLTLPKSITILLDAYRVYGSTT